MSSRKYRGKTQRIFLIECIVGKASFSNSREKVSKNFFCTDINEYSRSYMVCGTTKNVYKVTIKNTPVCTCPDHQMRRRRCKHIYFVLCRIMNVSPDKEDLKKYSNQDLLKMFTNIPPVTNNLIVNNNAQKEYMKHKKDGIFIGKDSTNKKDDKIKKQRFDDICPICLDDITDEEDSDFCKYSCGKSVHKICFEKWMDVTHSKKKCIFCQADWGPKKHNVTPSKYINLDNY